MIRLPEVLRIRKIDLGRFHEVIDKKRNAHKIIDKCKLQMRDVIILFAFLDELILAFYNFSRFFALATIVKLKHSC